MVIFSLPNAIKKQKVFPYVSRATEYLYLQNSCQILMGTMMVLEGGGWLGHEDRTP